MMFLHFRRNETTDQQSTSNHGRRRLIAQFEVSSKAAALNLAMKHVHTTEYDVVVVLDADNHVSSDFLEKLNDVFNSGVKAVPSTSGGKKQKYSRGSIGCGKRGNQPFGLSPRTHSSPIICRLEWFGDGIRFRLVQEENSAGGVVGEDKELELLLLQDKIFVDYLDDVHIWDEKIQQTAAFSRQRQRWLFAQYSLLWKGLKYLPQAVWQRIGAIAINYFSG